jgi:hypothetical protein
MMEDTTRTTTATRRSSYRVLVLASSRLSSHVALDVVAVTPLHLCTHLEQFRPVNLGRFLPRLVRIKEEEPGSPIRGHLAGIDFVPDAELVGVSGETDGTGRADVRVDAGYSCDEAGRGLAGV